MRMRVLGKLIRWTRRSWAWYRVSLCLGCVLRLVFLSRVVVLAGEVDRDRDRGRGGGDDS